MTTDVKARPEEVLPTTFGTDIKQNEATSQRMPDKVKAEISSFNPHCEQVTYTTLGCLAGTLRGVLNDGPAGIGKSRSTLELAKFLRRIADVRVVSGHITPLAMYKLLYECRHRKSVLIVDESFNLLAEKEIQQMLRSAMYSGLVDWQSRGKAFGELGIPDNFEFHGRIIFNTNVTNDKNFNHKALLDRVYYNKLLLTGAQITEKMFHKRSYTPDQNIWRFVEGRLILIRDGKIDTELTQEEKDEILRFTIDRILKISRTYNTNISMRILERVEQLCLFLKQLFGELDFEFAKDLAKNYFVVNDEEDLIKKVIAENGGTMAAKDLASILKDTQKYSLRTAQRRIREYVELGKILAPKRGLVALYHGKDVATPTSPAPGEQPPGQ